PYVHAALHAVEERRSERHVAVRGPAVGDLLDVRVDSEDLLDYDQAAAWRAGGCRAVGGELVSVFGAERERLTHRRSSFVARMPHDGCSHGAIDLAARNEAVTRSV